MVTKAKKQTFSIDEELKIVIATVCSSYFGTQDIRFRVTSVNKTNGMSLWKKSGLLELMTGSDYCRSL